MKAVGALQPDLAIVDITLKDTYGIELIKNLRSASPNLPCSSSRCTMSPCTASGRPCRGHGYLNKQEASKKVIAAIRHDPRRRDLRQRQDESAMLQKWRRRQRAGGAAATDVLTTGSWRCSSCSGQGLDGSADRRDAVRQRQDRRGPPRTHQAEAELQDQQRAAALRHPVPDEAVSTACIVNPAIII